METKRRTYQELQETLTRQSEKYTVKELKRSIVAMKIAKFLFQDAFMFIVTLTPFIILMWIYNFSPVMSTFALVTHFTYWVIVKRFTKNDGMDQHASEVEDMITIYQDLLAERK